MAVITFTGVIGKTGEGQYGPWAVVAETVTKRDGGTFDRRYMVSGKDIPAEGTRVVVTGYATPKVTERDGKHYADIAVNGAALLPLDEQSASSKPQSPETFEDDIPF